MIYIVTNMINDANTVIQIISIAVVIGISHGSMISKIKDLKEDVKELKKDLKEHLFNHTGEK